ncbi:MAG: hypothetical protein MUE73_00110 [Planctomycetes bacterium]|jgi:hypothetical protein|nr:hypothetical protein [Planctomycetota bacterium]
MGRAAFVAARGAVVLLLLTLPFTFVQIPAVRITDWTVEAAEAAGPDTGRPGTGFPGVGTARGWGQWTLLALGVAVLAATLLGACAVRREGAWPCWGALVRGLGEAAFLFALLGALTGLRGAMDTIGRLSAQVTPADIANGVSSTAALLLTGTAVALLGLLGSGIVRLASRR